MLIVLVVPHPLSITVPLLPLTVYGIPLVPDTVFDVGVTLVIPPPRVARMAVDDWRLRSTPVSGVAVAWTLTSRGVTEAILGTRSADQIEGWIDAATLLLSCANSGEIATAIGRTGAGYGPQLPGALAA